MDYNCLPGIQIGRSYVKNLSVDQLVVLQCTNLFRVQLILDKESKYCGMYEVVCCSPHFKPVMQMMMWLELDIAKTEAGKEFTGCPEYTESQVTPEEDIYGHDEVRCRTFRVREIEDD